MGDVLLHLKNLGFTDLEAKCLQVLAESGTRTGYEIAKQLGVSRSNVYSALQKLAEKGAVLTSHGEPTVYQSVPIEEIGERIEAELQASIRYVKAHMPKQDAQRSEYFSLEGDAKVIERIRTELRKAKEEALCDLWSEEAALLKEDLRRVPAQGVRLLVSTIGEVELPSGVLQFPHRRVEDWPTRNERKFTLLIDRKLAIIGTRGGDVPTLAMLTEHPAMVELLYSHFINDVVIHELKQDMGVKLEDKYGKNFKRIIQKYTGAKELDAQASVVGKSLEGKSSEAKSPEGKRKKKK
jgi:sugar-specific transcriptional regulator TrmB